MSTIDSAKKSGKGRPTVDSEAINVRMERPQLNSLDDWRRVQPDLPTRPEAVRRLVDRGLEAEKPGEISLLKVRRSIGPEDEDRAEPDAPE